MDALISRFAGTIRNSFSISSVGTESQPGSRRGARLGRGHTFISFFPEASEILIALSPGSRACAIRARPTIRVAASYRCRILLGPSDRWYRDCGIGLYSLGVRNYGEQASVRKVAIPNVLKVLLMFLLQNVSIRNSSPNPELELPRNNLPKRLFGRNTA